MKKAITTGLFLLTATASFAESDASEYDLSEDEYATLAQVYYTAKGDAKTTTPLGVLAVSETDEANHVQIQMQGIEQDTCETLIIADFGIEHSIAKYVSDIRVPRTISHPETESVCVDERNTLTWILARNEVEGWD